MDSIKGDISKWIVRHLIMGVIYCVSFSCITAQSNPILGKFSLSESKGHVTMYWQILAGNTCNGIQIYRSIDTLNFSRIGFIGGICGSVSESVNYIFTDSMPVLNAINYYYLEFGGVGSSQIIATEVIDKGRLGYQIRPHPVQDAGVIYFEAQVGVEYILQIFDLLGKEVYSAETSKDYFDFITSTFVPGPYVFSISALGLAPSISGILFIQH
jgi:hypothetical protein